MIFKQELFLKTPPWGGGGRGEDVVKSRIDFNNRIIFSRILSGCYFPSNFSMDLKTQVNDLGSVPSMLALR